jgi:hypothetical protein
MLGLAYIFRATLADILLRTFTGRATCGMNRANRCPYLLLSLSPPITLIRAPALATQTVPMLDPSVNPSLKSVGNHHVRFECRPSTIGESQYPES